MYAVHGCRCHLVDRGIEDPQNMISMEIQVH